MQTKEASSEANSSSPPHVTAIFPTPRSVKASLKHATLKSKHPDLSEPPLKSILQRHPHRKRSRSTTTHPPRLPKPPHRCNSGARHMASREAAKPQSRKATQYSMYLLPRFPAHRPAKARRLARLDASKEAKLKEIGSGKGREWFHESLLRPAVRIHDYNYHDIDPIEIFASERAREF
ncbi:hypothetical protein EYC84_011370 [Monilinia fructicola]|uniref:Uncharacterized protein n=1 Tax=Monilinia fructicola TaxID=38448 RepID=A0A5M9J840_MONFR|nr:hypothetical protein EYC84_011370 [Monilinia fructicola]